MGAPFFYLMVCTYLVFLPIVAYLLKLVCMPKIQSSADRMQFYQNRIDTCSDAITQLQGEIPENFNFSFSFNGVSVLQFDVSEDEAHFATSFFMSWHQFFSRKLKALKLETASESK